MSLAFILDIFGIKLPSVVIDVVGTVKNSVATINMMYLGALFYFSDWKIAFETKELYFGILIKMVLVPIVIGTLLKLTNLPQGMAYAMIILMALPTMTVVQMIVKIHGNEGAYAAGITVAPLAASAVIIPIVALFINQIDSLHSLPQK